MRHVGGRRRWRPHVNHSLPNVEQFLFRKTNKNAYHLFSVLFSPVRITLVRGERGIKISLVATSVLYNRRLRRLLFGDSELARWDRFNMIDLFILHFRGAFLRLLVNLITKCFISGHVKFSFIDRFLFTLFIRSVETRSFQCFCNYLDSCYCDWHNEGFQETGV